MFSSIFGEKLSDDIPYLNIFQKNLSPVLIIDNRPNKLQLVSIINEYNSGPSYGSKDFGGAESAFRELRCQILMADCFSGEARNVWHTDIFVLGSLFLPLQQKFCFR